MRIVAGLAAYNEEPYIGSVIVQAKQYIDEVIACDDGSRDKTSEVAELAGAKVLKHSTNQGKGAAIATILLELKDNPPDCLVLLDADGQHDPRDIPILIKAIEDGADLVIGSREKQEVPSYRRVGQAVLSYGTAVAGKKQIVSDTECGFRALSSRMIQALTLRETGFAVETEMIVQAVDKGMKIVEVPVSCIYTDDGSTMNPVVHGVGVLTRIVSMVSERRPLLFFGLAGLVSCLIALLAGVKVALAFKQSGQVAIGTALLSVTTFIIGMESIATGLMLNLIINRRLKAK